MRPQPQIGPADQPAVVQPVPGLPQIDSKPHKDLPLVDQLRDMLPEQLAETTDPRLLTEPLPRGLDPKVVESAAEKLAQAGLPAVAHRLEDAVMPHLIAGGAAASGVAVAGAGTALLMSAGVLGLAAMAYMWWIRRNFPNFKLSGAYPIPPQNLLGSCVSFMMQMRGYIETCIQKGVLPSNTLTKIRDNLMEALQALKSTEEQLRDHMQGFFDLVNAWVGEVNMLVRRMQLDAVSADAEGEEEDDARRRLAKLMAVAKQGVAQSAEIGAAGFETPLSVLELARVRLGMSLREAFVASSEIHLGVPVEEEDVEEVQAPQGYENLPAADLFAKIMEFMGHNLKHVDYAQSEESLGRLGGDGSRASKFFEGFLKGLSIMQDDMQRTREAFHALIGRLRAVTQSHAEIMRHVHELAKKESSDEDGIDGIGDVTDSDGQGKDDVFRAYRRLLHIHNMLETLV